MTVGVMGGIITVVTGLGVALDGEMVDTFARLALMPRKSALGSTPLMDQLPE